MIELLQQNFVPILFAGLLVFLLMGFPVAFSLAATGLAFGFLGMEIGLFPANLFQAFRGSVTPGGTGLGLAVAAELVRLHGGSIALEPSTTGAVFAVMLPARRANGH